MSRVWEWCDLKIPSLRYFVLAFTQIGSILSDFSNARQAGEISTFIKKERSIALQGILDNTGPGGRYSQGASSGVIIASPSTVNPNYLYTWTRDAALTMKLIVDEFLAGDKRLETTIKNYINANAIGQTLTNPSGNFNSGSGLGEPKFLISNQPFLGSWGRPQRDGPALRAIILMTYVEYLWENHQKDQAKKVVWPLIANDLNYVAQYWNETGFDLWEEVYGSSFFTVQNQHRALVQGGIVAKLIGEKCDFCSIVAPQISCFLQNFWNGHSVVANINTNNGRTGYDANTLLGAISTFDIAGSCTDGTFQPCNSKILASHKVLVDSFRNIYSVNKGRDIGKAAAVGRYAEDVYYNGNPWYLCTLSAAEVLYDAIAQWKAQGQLTIDEISLAFFRDIYPDIKAQTYRPSSSAYKFYSSSSEFDKIVATVRNYADEFVGIVRQYISQNGSIAEQFDRELGYPLSASSLTWSFASFVSMAERRSGYYPSSWRSRSTAAIPSKCADTSIQGTYVPATAAGAPPVSDLCTSQITFAVNVSTYFGENLYIQGNTTDLGIWDPENSYEMQASNYTDARHLWFIELQLPASASVTYNYFRVESDGSYIFETSNRTLKVPACGQPSLITNDAWMGTCSSAPNCT